MSAGQLAKRLIFSAIFVSLTLVTIFAAPDGVFFVVVAAFGLVALYEFYDLAEKKNIEINRFLGLFFGAVVCLSVYHKAESAALAAACLALFVFNFNRKEKSQALLSTAVTVFGIIYIPWFLAHLIKIKDLPGGAQWVFYSLLLVKGGDAFAYFIGRKYGKNKLIEHISPNKSVEGAIACLAGTILLSLLSKIYLPAASFLNLFILGAALGLLSQFGDLAESLLKREAGVKDSGSIPGLGGILDILDSIILTVPFVYYYVLHFILKAPL